MQTVQLSPVNKLALLNSNKAQRKSFCLQIIEQIENGEADPLEVHIFLKNIEQLFKMLTDEKTGKEYAGRYRDALINAALKEGSKTFEKYNAKFQVKEAGTKYNWDVCNDPVIVDLLLQEEELNKKVKERQEFLKNLPESGMICTDENTGDTAKIYRPSVSSTTTVSVTLA